MPPDPEELKRLGALLFEEGILTHEEIEVGLDLAGLKETSLGRMLLESHFVRHEDLTLFLARHFQIPCITLKNLKITPDVLRLVPADFAHKHAILPVARLGDILCIAKANFYNRAALIELREKTGFRTLVLQAEEDELLPALRRHYPAPSPAAPAKSGGTATMASAKPGGVPASAPAAAPRPPGAPSAATANAGHAAAVKLGDEQVDAIIAGQAVDVAHAFQRLYASGQPIAAVPLGQ